MKTYISCGPMNPLMEFYTKKTKNRIKLSRRKYVVVTATNRNHPTVHRQVVGSVLLLHTGERKAAC